MTAVTSTQLVLEIVDSQTFVPIEGATVSYSQVNGVGACVGTVLAYVGTDQSPDDGLVYRVYNHCVAGCKINQNFTVTAPNYQTYTGQWIGWCDGWSQQIPIHMIAQNAPVGLTQFNIQVLDESTGLPVNGALVTYQPCPIVAPCTAALCSAGSDVSPADGFIYRSYDIGCPKNCKIEQSYTISATDYTTLSASWDGKCDGSVTFISEYLYESTPPSGCTQNSDCDNPAGAGNGCCNNGTCTTCAAGYTCVNGTCQQTPGVCSCNSDCTMAGQYCIDGTCQTSVAVIQCACATDCPTGNNCVNGICTPVSTGGGSDLWAWIILGVVIVAVIIVIWMVK